YFCFFFFQAEDGIRDKLVTGVQTCALPIYKGLLLASERYPHSYPHCWRCKTELLFRLIDEWFINMSWREEITKICHDVRWIPDRSEERRVGKEWIGRWWREHEQKREKSTVL